MCPQICAEGLSKTYTVRKSGGSALRGFFRPEKHAVRALREVSFNIGQGELVGYIGPNGAGKSTTVKVLSGILRPDSGHCTALGMVPWKERQRYVARIGVVFGQRTQLWWDLPVRDSFVLLRDIYRMGKADFRKQMDALCSCLSLGPLLDTPVRQLSLGQRMRCELAASLLHDPDILFLDEPTIGLDAVSKLAVRAFIRERNRERGVTVILTTHDMDDVEALCTRIMLIGQGRILLDGALDLLRGDQHERILRAELERPLRTEDLPAGVTILPSDPGQCALRLDTLRLEPARLIAHLAAEYGVKDLTVERPAIEEIVAEQYRRIEEGA